MKPLKRIALIIIDILRGVIGAFLLLFGLMIFAFDSSGFTNIGDDNIYPGSFNYHIYSYATFAIFLILSYIILPFGRNLSLRKLVITFSLVFASIIVNIVLVSVL